MTSVSLSLVLKYRSVKTFATSEKDANLGPNSSELMIKFF